MELSFFLFLIFDSKLSILQSMKQNRTLLVIVTLITTCFIVTGYLLVFDVIDLDFGIFGLLTMHFFGSLVNLLLNNTGDIDHLNGYLFTIGQIIQFGVVFTFTFILAKLLSSERYESKNNK